MRSLARNVSTTASITTIRDDIAGAEETISDKTISSYLNALRSKIPAIAFLYILGKAETEGQNVKMQYVCLLTYARDNDILLINL